MVSNHGGRQLDHTVSPLRVLPAIKDAAGDIPVMLDGGIRRGTDVLKSLALGADFVFVGRPFNYAASIAGEAGVKRAYEILQGEVNRGMGQLGVTRLPQIGPEFLMRIAGIRSPGMPV
jgi:L-lactate dehydrogenase (cytochrome)